MRPSLVTNHRVLLMIVVLVSLASFLVGSTFTGESHLSLLVIPQGVPVSRSPELPHPGRSAAAASDTKPSLDAKAARSPGRTPHQRPSTFLLNNAPLG